MPMVVVSNALQTGHVFQKTIDSGEGGKFEVRVFNKTVKNYIQLLANSDELGAIKHDYQVQEFVVQGASQDNQVNCVQILVVWFEFLKKAIGIHEKRHDSYTAQAKNVKPHRRGMYTFLYGGRVNVNTFYDYKDEPQ